MTSDIHLEPQYLPLYALYSLGRGVGAYGVSLVFTLFYGYAMARIARAGRILGPLLDVLQSIPVLGFLPGFVLGLAHLFPGSNLGLELASVLMIFTGQVWNMTFAFQASLKAVPTDWVAVSDLARMSWWERFWRLDLPFATTSLLWNSMMSMAGGWFFLMVSEAFVLGEQDFRLPGLGSYMSVAVERGDLHAQGMGLTALLVMIVAVDQGVWRPLVAWSQKFTDEPSPPQSMPWPWNRLRCASLTALLRRPLSAVRHRWDQVTGSGAFVSFFSRIGRRPVPPHVPWARSASPWVLRALVGVASVGVAVAVFRTLILLERVSLREWVGLLQSTGITFLRVLAAVVIGTLWTVPAGVWIGQNPRASRLLQPVLQLAASFPAPMVFPILVGALMSMGVGLGIGSVALMVLGTQWYLLFNVIAGTGRIPRSLWEVARLVPFTRWQRWRHLILPGVFPSLVTGWITAAGGAWNASIVAEYLRYDGRTLETLGLGATISRATERGEFHLLAAGVGLMAVTVVGFNRIVWRRLEHLARSQYSLET